METSILINVDNVAVVQQYLNNINTSILINVDKHGAVK